MGIVHKRIRRNAAQQAGTFPHSQGVPSDVRGFHGRWELPALAWEDSWTCDLAALFTAFEKPLHSKADSEDRRARVKRLEHRFLQP